MINQIQNLIRRNPYVAVSLALALVAALGWSAGRDTRAIDARLATNSNRFETPHWAQLAIGEQRGLAIGMSPFAPDPDAKPETPPQAAAEIAATAEVAEDDSDDQAWRFFGTVEREQGRFAVILVGKSRTPTFVASGSTLPNGEVLISIEADRIAYDANNEKHTVRLFERVRK